MTLSRFLSLVFSTATAFTAFGAVYRPEALGFLAASPGVLLIACCLPLVVIKVLVDYRVAAYESALAWRLLGFGVFASVFSVLLFGWSDFLLAKSGALMLLLSVWVSPLLFFDVLRIHDLKIGLTIALLISAVGYVFGDVIPHGLPEMFRQTIFGSAYQEYLHERPRGFMEETSHFATLVGRYLMILFLFWEARRRPSTWRLAGFTVILTGILVLTGSKGAAISGLLAILSIAFSRRGLPYLVTLAPISAWIGAIEFESISYDIENFTSTSTRFILWFTCMAAVLANFCGYGYYGFYGAMQQFGRWALNWLGERLPITTTEVADIVDNLNNVSTKSTIFDFTLTFGVFFVWMMVALARRIDLSDPRAKTAYVYLLLTALASSGHESLSFFLLLTVLLKVYPKSNASRYSRLPI